jgi:hypothetical protein
MPSLLTTPFTSEEDALLEQKQSELGFAWQEIAVFFVGRTYINVKNRWLFLSRQRSRRSVPVPDAKPRPLIPVPIFTPPAPPTPPAQAETPVVARVVDPMPDTIPWSDQERFSDEDDDGRLYPESTDLSTDYLCVNFVL